MGHSFGGLLTQMLADRDLGVAYVGVTPDSPPASRRSRRRRCAPASRSSPTRSTRTAPKPISKAHFHFTFGNDSTRAESDKISEEFAVNSCNWVFFEGVAGAFNEKGGVSHVDYAKTDRAPLLVITGEIDHVVPPAIGKAIVKKYQATGSPSVVEYKEYAGRTHRIVSQDGWEEVAEYALNWAVSHAQVNA